jgi:hypothetical protein
MQAGTSTGPHAMSARFLVRLGPRTGSGEPLPASSPRRGIDVRLTQAVGSVSSGIDP